MFVKGQSGNPNGSRGWTNRKRLWITESRKIREARKTFDNLCNLRDGMILERRTILDQEGNEKTVEVVPSIKEFIACNALILDRTLGKPLQQVEVKDADNAPLKWELVLQQPKTIDNAEIIDTKQLEPPATYTFSYKDSDSPDRTDNNSDNSDT